MLKLVEKEVKDFSKLRLELRSFKDLLHEKEMFMANISGKNRRL